jgi:PAS domain S-box-containing protein
VSARLAVALWTLALALSAGAVALVLQSHHEDSPRATITVALAAALAFVGAGLIAWMRRPENRTGPLMTLVGFAWMLGVLPASNNSVVFTIGLAIGSVAFAFLIHLVLAYPTGRLEDRAGRIVTGAAYALLFAVVPLALLFHDPQRVGDCGPDCPANAVMVVDNERLSAAIELVVLGLGLALAVAILVLITRRWLQASPPQRRVLTPVYAASAFTFVVAAAFFVLEPISNAAASAVGWVLLCALATVPLAFLFSLLQSRLARGGVGRLLLELGRTPDPRELEAALRRALGDPSLTLAYWIDDCERYVDIDGRPVSRPTEGGRRYATTISSEGKHVAVLLHDASLLEDPVLMNSVAAAAGLALEHERGLRALQASERRNRALLGAIPDNMYRIARDGTYLDFHANTPEDLLAEPDAIVGRNMAEYLPAEIDERIQDGVARALDTREVVTIEYRILRSRGMRDCEARIMRSGEDEVVLIVRDVTDKKSQEAELKASRARIVEVGDAERRRLERNLHDGAQQRLVALSLSLRLARAKLERDPQAAIGQLVEAEKELSQALEDLRELARGIHPAVLTDRGLEPALETLVSRLPVPVEVEVTAERLPGAVEAAAYYVVSEALANVVKYAQASNVSVSVSRMNGRVLVDVQDDGVGGAEPADGTGLRGLADRVSALEGRLAIDSRTGDGTRVRAEIPIGAGS